MAYIGNSPSVGQFNSAYSPAGVGQYGDSLPLGNLGQFTSGATSGGALSPSGSFKMTDGWYVAMACIGGVMTANTRFGPIAFGILTIALIYQTNLLLQGK